MLFATDRKFRENSEMPINAVAGRESLVDGVAATALQLSRMPAQ